MLLALFPLRSQRHRQRTWLNNIQQRLREVNTLHHNVSAIIIVEVRTDARRAQTSEEKDTRIIRGMEGMRLTKLARDVLQRGEHPLEIYAMSARARATRISERRDSRGQQVGEWTSEVTWQGRTALDGVRAHSSVHDYHDRHQPTQH